MLDIIFELWFINFSLIGPFSLSVLIGLEFLDEINKLMIGYYMLCGPATILMKLVIDHVYNSYKPG